MTLGKGVLRIKIEKKDKERIFKWTVKKIEVDVRNIVKWCVICYKVGVLDAKC